MRGYNLVFEEVKIKRKIYSIIFLWPTYEWDFYIKIRRQLDIHHRLV